MQRENDIINSLDRIEPATAPQQLYAGIRAKMARQEGRPGIKMFFLRPAFVAGLLFIFFVANIATLVLADHPSKNMQHAGSGVQAFAQEYNVSTQTIGQ